MLSLIVPFFNEQETILKNYKILKKYLDKNFSNYELIFVNDGSTDKSYKLLKKKKYKNKKLKIITYNINRGRGYAVTAGFKYAHGDILGYIDSDLEISPKYIRNAVLKLSKFDVSIASKYHQKSKVITTKIRNIASKVFNYYMKIILRSNVSDHQAGLKFFRNDVIQQVLPQVKSWGWFFDVELLYYIQKNHYSICEIPIRIKYGSGHFQWSFISGFINSLYTALKLRLKNLFLI